MAGGPAGFARDSTSPVLLRNASQRLFQPSSTRLSRAMVGLSRPFDWPISTQGAHNPRTNSGLGYSAFARRYSRNSCLSLFLQVLRCFSSLGSLVTPMNSAERTCKQVSFLIRTSPDQCSFASSPELIAGYNVLHRLSMPRHPPYTLSSLTTFIDHRHKRLSTCEF